MKQLMADLFAAPLNTFRVILLSPRTGKFFGKERNKKTGIRNYGLRMGDDPSTISYIFNTQQAALAFIEETKKIEAPYQYSIEYQIYSDKGELIHVDTAYADDQQRTQKYLEKRKRWWIFW